MGLNRHFGFVNKFAFKIENFNLNFGSKTKYFESKNNKYLCFHAQ